jgi:hypothetical protein
MINSYKNNHYERIGILSTEEVFPYIAENFHHRSTKCKVNIKTFYVNVNSLRLRTFYHSGVECHYCGIIGTYFAIEKTPGNDHTGYHLNLYGIDKSNNEILFTHDHIIAKAFGGENKLHNTQTMCGPCNWSKGRLEQQIANSERNKLSDEEISELHTQINRYKKVTV